MVKLIFDSHYKDLFEKTSDLIHFANISGKIETVNTSWLTLLGYTAEEVQGKSILDYILAENQKLYHTIRDQVIKYGFSEKQIEFSFLKKNGTSIVVEGEIGGVIIDGELVYTRGVFRNITGRKSLEKEKEILHQRLTTFFQFAPDAVIVINEKQLIYEWNKKAELIFGFTKAEVQGKLLSDIIIPIRYREAHKVGMEHFLKTGKGPVLNTTIEIFALNSLGLEFPINLSISSVFIDDEWLFIAFLSDLTEKKASAEKTQRQETELTQSKLLNERKNDFLSIASHELKTPLTIIKAFSQLALMLGQKNADPVILSYLEKINNQTTKITHLVNDLLDVSKIQSGKMILTKKMVNSQTFLQEAINTVEHIVSTHKVILTISDSIPIPIDALRIEQVLTNLITNAAKYSPGKPNIEVSSYIQGKFIIISVKDYGLGISQQNQGKLFGKFYRVEEIINDFSGFGIGLYISSEIIKQHSGDIWVESEPNLGSTFSFSIPLN